MLRQNANTDCEEFPSLLLCHSNTYYPMCQYIIINLLGLSHGNVINVLMVVCTCNLKVIFDLIHPLDMDIYCCTDTQLLLQMYESPMSPAVSHLINYQGFME